MATKANSAYTGLRHEILDKVPSNAMLIVDVGAADGALGARLLEQSSGRCMIGIEADLSLAASARTRLTAVHCSDAETLEWATVAPGEAFDCLIFGDVLEHLRDPTTTLTNAAERVALDGTVIVSLPNVRHISALWQIFVKGTFPQRSRGLFDRSHLRWFTASDARSLCTSAGLDVITIDYRLRLFDLPGGGVNRFLGAQNWVRHIPVLRELLAYQVVLTARRQTAENSA